MAPEPVLDDELLYPSLTPGAGEARVPPPLPWRADPTPDEASFGDAQQSPRVSQALKLRVQAFGREYPLWVLLLPASAGLFVVATLLGVAVSHRHVAPPAPAVVAPPAPVPVVASVPVPAPTLDAAAIRAKPPEARTIAETLALGSATGEKKRDAAAKRTQEILQAPASFRKKGTLSEMRKLATDPVTSTPTLAAVANLPGPLSPDLLYEIWSSAPKTDAAELAHALLSTQEVRAKASDALAILLQIRAVEAYADLGPLLERARQVGDKRVLGPLKKWKHKKPCTAKSHGDCCPRELSKLIDATIDEAKRRRAPFDAH